jgi:cytochrome c oxidase subunit 3
VTIKQFNNQTIFSFLNVKEIMATDNVLEAHGHEQSGDAWSGGKTPFKASYGKLMMWYFLLSDAFTFAGFLIAYGALRFSVPTWPLPDTVFSTFPGGIHDAPLIFVTLMTFILIVSSVTMVRAVQEGHRENKKGVAFWMLLTIVGGLTFLGCQAWEWTTLIAGENMSVTRNTFGSHTEAGVYLDDEHGHPYKEGAEREKFEKGDTYLLHEYHAGGHGDGHGDSHGDAGHDEGDHGDGHEGDSHEGDHEEGAHEGDGHEDDASHSEGDHGDGKGDGEKPKAKEDHASDVHTIQQDPENPNDKKFVSRRFITEAGVEGHQTFGPYQFGALFFFITGFHGFHVFSGVAFLIIILLNVVSGLYVDRKNGYEMVEKIGLYWHFVDLVWVFVFLVFYLL